MKKIIPFMLISSFLLYNTDSTAQTTSYPTNSELFENKRVVITGGTGYLGHTIACEILKYNPKKIIIFSRDEVKQAVSKRTFNNPRVQNTIGDIRNYETILRCTKDADIVIHAAALKRIDSLEENTQEGILTNVLGTLNIFNACVANNVDRALFISTDKASSPINIYGGCKFISEKLFTNYDYEHINTIFTVVRFGNILESTGSVIPFFTDKILKGEDITLTDDRMTRFIIAKDEAIEFILDAVRYSIGGEIFIKRLPAMRIIDLIEILKEKYHAHNNIRTIGLRPGEKIHELLINESEMSRSYEFGSMCVITPSLP